MKPHEWVIGHRGGDGVGTYDPNTGIYTPPPGAAAFDEGAAHVQAGGEAIARRSSGQPVKDASGTIFLRPARRALLYEPDDAIEAFYQPVREDRRIRWRTASAVVLSVRPEDGALVIQYQ